MMWRAGGGKDAWTGGRGRQCGWRFRWFGNGGHGAGQTQRAVEMGGGASVASLVPMVDMCRGGVGSVSIFHLIFQKSMVCGDVFCTLKR